MLPLMGLVIGLLLGLGLTFFLEYWDDTLKTPDDVERFIHLPVMGTVPKMLKSNNVQELERIVEFYPKSIITESYQSIRTNILFSSSKPIKTMVITSSAMSEGKTTTASNVAQVMAAAGDKVLLIDADMRRPRVHKIFGLENEGGLSAYLVGMKEIGDLVSKTTMPNLDIINAGHTPPVPVELLNSPRLGELIKWAGEHYDRVIVDAPPYMVVTDSAIIAQHTDAALLVANGDRTPRDQVKNCVLSLKKININVLGIILNNVDDHIIAFQMRALSKNVPKDKRFLTFNLDRIYKKILRRDDVQIPDDLNTLSMMFNIYNVNMRKPVILTEGPMDSYLVPNCVCTTGANKKLPVALPFWYLYDSDKTGKAHAMKMLAEKKKVFLWGRLKRDLGLPERKKWDVNDVVIWCRDNKPAGFTVNWYDYFSDNPIDMINIDSFRLRL